MNDENRTRRIADDAFGGTAEDEMFQPGISARCHDDQIDIDLLREPANLFKRPAFYRVNIRRTQRHGIIFGHIPELAPHLLPYFQLRHNQWNCDHARRRIVGLENVNEMQIGPEMLDQGQSSFDRLQ